MIYLLSYELKTQDHDYTSLYSYLEHEIGISTVHVLRDTWWIATAEPINVEQISKVIKSKMGENDNLFLSRLSDNEIDGWLPSTLWKWYVDNIEKHNIENKNLEP